MKIIDLATEHIDVEDLLQRAVYQPPYVRTSSGKLFAVTEIAALDEEDDFAQEVALTRQNAALEAV